MTNEQHIENLKKLKSFHNGSYGASINAAIKALEQQSDTVPKSVYMQVARERDIAIEQLNELGYEFGEKIEQSKTGHWITQWNAAHQKEYYYCSECREEFSYDGETGIKMNDYDFCPNCGAKMIEPQERSNKE